MMMVMRIRERGGGGASIFCPCLFFNINQCSEIIGNLVFAESVDGITSFGLSLDGFFFTFCSPGAAPSRLHKDPTSIRLLHQILTAPYSQLLIPGSSVPFSYWMFLLFTS